jgi:hypothetical protein
VQLQTFKPSKPPEEIDAFLDTLPPRRYKNAASPDVKIGKNWSDNFTKQKGKMAESVHTA